MEKNHFEEQVQKKLAELIIQPSEKAWTGIEGRIGKKDSRKKILWLFFVGILLLAGGIVLFQTYEASQEKKMGHFSEKNNKTRVKTNSTSDTSEFTSKMADKTVVIDTAAISPYSESNNLITGIKMKIIQNNQQDIQPDGSLSADEFSNLNTPESQLLEIRFSGDLAKKEELKKLQPTLNKEENVAGLEIALPIDSFVLMNKLDEEVMIENSFPDKIKIEEIVPKDLSKQTGPSNNIKESNSTLEKWETGFSIAAGKFHLGNGIHFGFTPHSNNLRTDLNYSSPGPSTGSGSNQAGIGPPSSMENSIEFKAGIVFRKSVSRKSTFTTGLGYSYYTNTIMIGSQLPSGNYSSVGMLTSYRNNFHFIDLPLSMRFHLNEHAKIPLSISAGLTFSQLVSSDAMQYKRGFYSVDNSLFHKTQVGFHAGLNAEIFKKVTVGPYYNYGINSLSKTGLYGKKHLNSYGLKAEFLFRKNK